MSRKKKWKCKECGSCCEALYELVFGHPCKAYDKVNKKCLIYEDRPDICRSSTTAGLGITDKEYITNCRRCQVIAAARRQGIKDDERRTEPCGAQ